MPRSLTYTRPDMAFSHRGFRAGLYHLLAALVLTAGLSGCLGLFAAVEEGGEPELAAVGGIPTPGTSAWNEFMISRAEFLFGRAYRIGKYWPVEAAYEPGDWTRFRHTSATSEAPSLAIERTYVRVTEDGNQWWRLIGEQEDRTWVYEILLDPDQQELLRMRAQDPKGQIREIPVTEDRQFYPDHQTLADQSLEKATTGSEEIKTPAGTFTADRVEYTASGSEEAIWWMSEEVPGQIVQYRLADAGESWTSTLIDYGTRSDPQLQLEGRESGG